MLGIKVELKLIFVSWQVIRPVYDRLHNEIKKLEVPDNPSSVESPGQDQALLSDLAMQISRFIAARKEMIDLYPH